MKRDIFVVTIIVLCLIMQGSSQSLDQYIDCTTERLLKDCTGTSKEELKPLLTQWYNQYPKKGLVTGAPLMSCGTKELVYVNGFFSWGDEVIQCPTVKYETNIVLTGDCPLVVVGENNTISQDCSERTISISISRLELILYSFGGLTIFGIGIHFVIKFFKKRKTKKSVNGKPRQKILDE